MRKLFLVSMIALVIVLTGCVDIHGKWILGESGDLRVEVTVSEGSLGEDEFDAYINLLKMMYAPLLSDVEIERKVIKENYSEKLVYVFRPKSKISIADLGKYGIEVSFKSNRFVLKIPKFFEDEPYSPDDVIATFEIVFPKDIDIANTAMYSGNKAIWKITREMLYTGTTLKVYLVE